MAVNMLLSYAFNQTTDLGKYRAKMPCGRLLIDSGAYTAASVGKVIDRAAYADFLTTWAGVYDHAVTLDVIGDPVATRVNTRWLHSRGVPVLPVFTRGGKPADFDAMVRDSGYVCVGGGVGMPQAAIVKRLRALQLRAEELGGGIHALGVGGLPALRQIRPYSADSSSVSAVFLYGRVYYYDGKNLRSFTLQEQAKIRANLHHFRASGLDMATLLKTRRQPKGAARIPLMRGMIVAHSAADEDTVRFKVPVPHGIRDTSGTHMYAAVTGGFLAPATAGVDESLHDPEWSVPLWERYRTKHQAQCRAGARVAS